jgi:hypothetical protein
MSRELSVILSVFRFAVRLYFNLLTAFIVVTFFVLVNSRMSHLSTRTNSAFGVNDQKTTLLIQNCISAAQRFYADYTNVEIQTEFEAVLTVCHFMCGDLV